MAADFPFAVVYPINTFVASNPESVEGSSIKRLVDDKIPVVRNLILGLEMLVDPLVVYQAWLADVGRLLEAKKGGKGGKGKGGGGNVAGGNDSVGKKIDDEIRWKWKEMKEKIRCENSEPGPQLKKLRILVNGWIDQVRCMGVGEGTSKELLGDNN